MPERECKAYKIIIMKKQFKRALSALVLFVACLSSGYAQENLLIDSSCRSEAGEENVSQSEVLGILGLHYAADLDYIDQGMYGYGFNVLKNKHIGVSFSINSDMGLVDSDYSSYLVKIGPNYSYAISDKLWFFAPLCVDLVWSNYPEYKSYNKKEIKKEFNWGLDLTPALAFKLGKLVLSAGIQFNWMEGASKIGTAGMIGIGYTLK